MKSDHKTAFGTGCFARWSRCQNLWVL